MNNMTDQQLVTDYLKAKPKIASVLRKMRVLECDIDDLLQVVFIKAWKARSNFRGTCKVSTWLTRIAINEVYQGLRKKNPTVELEPLLEYREFASHEVSAETKLYRKQQKQIVKQLVKRLGRPCDARMVLLVLDGMSYQEVAKTCGYSPVTPKSVFSRVKEDVIHTLRMNPKLAASYGIEI